MEILPLLVIAAIAGLALGLASAEPKIQRVETKLRKAEQQFQSLQGLFDESLQELRQDSVLLPSLARWAERVAEARDEALSMALETKKHPAPKAAEQVRIAKAEARQAKREFELTLSRAQLYESLAPWLAEFTDLTVAELIEGLREKEEASVDAEPGEDPVSRYIPRAEWKNLSPSERNQRALDRYCDPRRKRTPWAAGIQYERYVGYVYEQSGFRVQYRGAVHGREDLGIDLLCENNDSVLVVQCKRLSPEKQLPVRENVVAQVFGSAMFHRMCSGTSKAVRPVLVTTYELSAEARRFAKYLGVQVREHLQLKPYPMIKCNISHGDGNKIYHLPMDQQYDKTIVGDQAGEFYASTVSEAERAGFRRAHRWKGGKA